MGFWGISLILSLFIVVSGCGDTSVDSGLDLGNGSGSSSENSTVQTETPIVSSSLPASPALTQNPAVLGTSEPNASVQIFSDSSCSTQVGSGTASASGVFNITLSTSQEGGTTTSYHARATASNKTISDCSSSSISFSSTAIRTGLGWFSGTQTTAPSTPTKVNQAIAYAIQWSSSEFDSNYYSHSTSSSSHQVTIQQAGDYQVAVTLPLRMISGTYRATTRLEVRVNGTLVPGAIGESSYIRFDVTGNDESSSHASLLLRGLSQGDTVEVFVSETAGEDGTELVNITDQSSLYLEFVSSSRNLFTANATRLVSGTNLNPAAKSSLEWSEDRKNSGFTHSDASNSHNITLSAGYHLVYVNIPVNSTAQRAAPQLFVELNGTTVNGGQASQAYMRADSGHNDASLQWSGMINASGGDILTVAMQQEALAGTATVQAGTSAQITVERLSSTTGMIALRATALSGGTNWNPAAADTILWDTQDSIDANVFTHSTIANQHQITVNQSGDYLLNYNDVLTSALQRSNPIIRVQVNGTNVPGAESKTHYARNQNSHTDTTASLVYLLRNLSAGDVITLTTEQETLAGTVNDLDDALLSIIKK